MCHTVWIMTHFFHQINLLINESTLFWYCAALGSFLFVLQLMFSFFGHIDYDHLEHDKSGMDKRCVWMLHYPLTGFLMMFSWIALIGQKLCGLNLAFATGLGVLGGLAAVFSAKFLFKAPKVQNPGAIEEVVES